MARNLKLTVAYDGTRFHGWQAQAGLLTVEGSLLEALEALLGERVRLYSASRTDAGVHAEGQVVSFSSETRIPAERLASALNGRLPADIRVRSAEEAPPQFHARYSAVGKNYRYLIDRRPVPGIFLSRRAPHFPRPLHPERIAAAARTLVGQHDFRAFGCAEAGGAERDAATLRTIYGIVVFATDEVLAIDVWGSSFLYKMVRVLAGSLLEVGRGRWAEGRLRDALESRDRRKAGPTLPAAGLCLRRVYYDLDALRASVEAASLRSAAGPCGLVEFLRELAF